MPDDRPNESLTAVGEDGPAARGQELGPARVSGSFAADERHHQPWGPRERFQIDSTRTYKYRARSR